MYSIESQITKLKDAKRAKANAWFFKTKKAEYGEGDKFLGVRVPQVRAVIKENIKNTKIGDAISLLKSSWHEVRLAGCILLVELRRRAVKRGDSKEEKKIYQTYLKNTKYINNWDMVDISAGEIVGKYLMGKDKTILYRLAKSKSLWERRIAIIATGAFIAQKDCTETFLICEMLLKDTHDLIHKACGWMLREVGKNCGLAVLNKFLDKHAFEMPRTMLRYALEKHSETKRRRYLHKIHAVK